MYSGMNNYLEMKCNAAIKSGSVCKHCGVPIWDNGSGYYHIVSFMTICGGSRDTYAEIDEGKVITEYDHIKEALPEEGV